MSSTHRDGKLSVEIDQRHRESFPACDSCAGEAGHAAPSAFQVARISPGALGDFAPQGPRADARDEKFIETLAASTLSRGSDS